MIRPRVFKLRHASREGLGVQELQVGCGGRIVRQRYRMRFKRQVHAAALKTTGSQLLQFGSMIWPISATHWSCSSGHTSHAGY